MEIEFKNTLDDYKSYYKQLYIKEFKKRIGYILLLPLFIGFLFAGEPFDLFRFLYFTAGSAVIYIGLFYLRPYLLALYKLQKLVKAEPGYLHRKKLRITEKGLEYEAAENTDVWLWESITSIDTNTEFIALLMVDNRFTLISKNAFKNDNESVNFIGIIQSKISKPKIASKSIPNVYTPPKKPPYLLGILCFIPLVGAFVGLVFIVLGLSRFKDKWFTLIGVLGILFTVIIYSSLFYTTEHSSFFKESKKIMSQTSLNDLVKEIEFYKLENGQYPDSLQQLKNKDKIVSIYDPVQPLASESSIFEYERREGFYNLFSSGNDGIPYTDDDFYPEISKKSIGKLGLLNYELEAD